MTPKRTRKQRLTEAEEECTAVVDAAYAEYLVVRNDPHTSDDLADAWDTAVEKRDKAYARFAAMKKE